MYTTCDEQMIGINHGHDKEIDPHTMRIAPRMGAGGQNQGRETHICDKVIKRLLLLAELHDDGQDVVG